VRVYAVAGQELVIHPCDTGGRVFEPLPPDILAERLQQMPDGVLNLRLRHPNALEKLGSGFDVVHLSLHSNHRKS
jgi:hypothetical protein